MCVSKCSIVIASRPSPFISGMNWTTESPNRIFPCSIRIMMLVVVATTLVRLAISKIVSVVIASRCGSTARAPYALRQTVFPWRPTRTTAPGKSFFAIEAWMTASMRARRSAENPADAGEADGSCVEKAWWRKVKTNKKGSKRDRTKLITPASFRVFAIETFVLVKSSKEFVVSFAHPS